MSRKTTLILAILLCLLLAVAIFVVPQGPPSSGLPAAFLDFARADVRSLDIKNLSGEIHLERDAKEREKWRVRAGNTLVRAASDKVEDLLNEISRMAPKGLWPKATVKPEERKRWGLDASTLQVTVGLEGRTLKASFGVKTGGGSQGVYAENEAGGDVYVVPSPNVDPLDGAKAAGLRERRPVGFSSYEAKTLSVRRADKVELAAEKAPGGTWELTAPAAGPADPTKIEDLLSKVLNIEVADFVSDGAPDLGRHGLLEPEATITVRREAREKPVVVILGKPDADGRTCFMEEGEPSIYSGGQDLLKAVQEMDPAAFRDRNLLRIGWAKIDSIEFVHPEKGWKLLRVMDRWDVEKPERVPADATEVEELLRKIREAEIVKFLDGEDAAKLGLNPPEDAAARLVLTGTDEAGSRTLLFGKKDAEGRVPARLLPPKGAKGDPGPVLVGKDLWDILERDWLSWRGREVLKVEISEVRGISRKTEKGEERYVREYQVWKAVPGGKEPDPAALTSAITHLLTLNCSGFAAKTKEGLDKWGLGDVPAGPAVTVHIRKDAEKEEHTRTLVFGLEPPGGGSHYARLSDGDLVFLLPDHFANGATVVAFYDLMNGDWAKVPEAPKEEKPK